LVKKNTEDWAHKFFVKNPELYMPILKRNKAKAKKEAIQLDKLFRKFNVSYGSRILDFSCGIGRHSINLVKLGYEVVGYDPSSYYINEAKQSAKRISRLEKKIRFYEGDTRNAVEVLTSHRENNFAGIILMEASHGYSSEFEDIEMLKHLFQVAEEGCVLIIESENRDYTLKNFRTNIHYDFEKYHIDETWHFNYETSVSEGYCTYYYKDSKENLRLILELNTRLRLYSLHELIRIIQTAGWTFRQCYGNLMKIEKPDYDSLDLITVSQKCTDNENS
jgi:SAM-dependent methyltransferase